MKIVFLEGLPRSGKTSIVEKIKKKEINGLYTVDEIIKTPIDMYNDSQDYFMSNDDLKVNAYKSGCVVIDRGPISTLSYNQARHITDPKFDYDIHKVEKWFEKYLELYSSENVFVYFLFKENNIFIPRVNGKDPYGSEINQKLLGAISEFNCHKYVKNLIIKKSYSVDEVVNEIINKFSRP